MLNDTEAPHTSHGYLATEIAPPPPPNPETGIPWTPPNNKEGKPAATTSAVTVFDSSIPCGHGT